MMTVQTVAETVLYQPCGTLRALDAMATGTAQRQRRIPATIKKQQGLLPFLQCLFHGMDQWRRQPAPLVWLLHAKIDAGNFRQLCPGISARQYDMPVTSAARIDVALD